MTTDTIRIRGFQHDFARRQATRVVEFPGGFAVHNDDYPDSYEHNRAVVTGTGRELEDPQALLGIVEEVFTEAGHRHRQVLVEDDALGEHLAPAFVAAGYEHGREVVLRRAPGGGEAAVGVPVEEALDRRDLDLLVFRDWRATLPPEVPDDVVWQLAHRRSARLRGADEVAFLVVRAEGGVRAYVDLYRTGWVAQIEDLLTEPGFGRRGYAGALIAEALRRAGAAGAELVFIVADVDDWPHGWYARLGFTEALRQHSFTRSP
ncbi:ribosomal protein S18 acetylase RimI-like enzyme [Allocatelliglobosispora scoriae]|uniref:Ribosomal protein S18 acetylase RimI-like enzyme n=1 Tax=Allocatelliglobosispora scoriae TaxID=643052 RepID=A0A841BNU2_9ACTN|nr:GNAT family N-acetyltransferase [Allocatelliglobosispora scoriae]MBB5868402.1 ribosomal protein S18 acetylase RimI-like enzyme [Allocatelliglobosispora scoriae]